MVVKMATLTETDVTHGEVTSATGLVNTQISFTAVETPQVIGSFPLSRKTLPHPCTTKSIRNRSLQPAQELQCSSTWHPHL